VQALFGGSTRTIPARTHNAPTLATPPPNSARTAPRSAAAALRTESVLHPKTAPVQRLYRLYSTHTVSAQNPSQHLYCTSDLEALFPKLRDLALGCGICMCETSLREEIDCDQNACFLDEGRPASLYT